MLRTKVVFVVLIKNSIERKLVHFNIHFEYILLLLHIFLFLLTFPFLYFFKLIKCCKIKTSKTVKKCFISLFTCFVPIGDIIKTN